MNHNVFISEDEIRIQKEISRDSISVDYAGVCRNSKVSVKLLERDIRFQNNFENEMEMVKRIFHPNIILYLGKTTIRDRVGIVTELIEQSLEDLLFKSRQELSFMDKMNISIQICNAISWLHQQNPPVYHQHLTSKNCYVDPDLKIKIGFNMSEKIRRNERIRNQILKEENLEKIRQESLRKQNLLRDDTNKENQRIEEAPVGEVSKKTLNKESIVDKEDAMNHISSSEQQNAPRDETRQVEKSVNKEINDDGTSKEKEHQKPENTRQDIQHSQKHTQSEEQPNKEEEQKKEEIEESGEEEALFYKKIAPEILRGENFSEESDVYSFSFILFELFTRQQPFLPPPLQHHKSMPLLKSISPRRSSFQPSTNYPTGSNKSTSSGEQGNTRSPSFNASSPNRNESKSESITPPSFSPSSSPLHPSFLSSSPRRDYSSHYDHDRTAHQTEENTEANSFSENNTNSASPLRRFSFSPKHHNSSSNSIPIPKGSSLNSSTNSISIVGSSLQKEKISRRDHLTQSRSVEDKSFSFLSSSPLHPHPPLPKNNDHLESNETEENLPFSISPISNPTSLAFKTIQSKPNMDPPIPTNSPNNNNPTYSSGDSTPFSKMSNLRETDTNFTFSPQHSSSSPPSPPLSSSSLNSNSNSKRKRNKRKKKIIKETLKKSERPLFDSSFSQRYSSVESLIKQSWSTSKQERSSFTRLKNSFQQIILDSLIKDQSANNFWMNNFAGKTETNWSTFLPKFVLYLRKNFNFNVPNNMRTIMTHLKILFGVERISEKSENEISSFSIKMERFGNLVNYFAPLDASFPSRIFSVCSQPYFFSFLDTTASSNLLNGRENGSYLVRFSSSSNCYTLSFTVHNQVKHIRIEYADTLFSFQSHKFATLGETVDYLKQKFRLTTYCPGGPFAFLNNEGKEEINGYVEYVSDDDYGSDD